MPNTATAYTDIGAKLDLADLQKQMNASHREIMSHLALLPEILAIAQACLARLEGRDATALQQQLAEVHIDAVRAAIGAQREIRERILNGGRRVAPSQS